MKQIIKTIAVIGGLACSPVADSQVADSVLTPLNEVVISGMHDVQEKNTPFNISRYNTREVIRDINYSVCDALAKLPGVHQLTTGVGVSKPVIRGLYGNRIQTVLMGIRFDNQQWQDEHGLGLSIVGIDHIEILKGASSLLYGTEAMGGVIRIVEESKAPVNSIVGDASTTFFVNTLGNSTQVGFKGNDGKKFWRIRASVDTHADYKDGNNNRVLNSRFNAYNLKTSLGFTRKNLENVNHLYLNYSQFGFITENNQDKKPIDNIFSRTMDGPNHSVFFAILSTENTISLKKSTLKVNGGYHMNVRLENEGGNKISLNMQLNTVNYNLRWYKPLSPRFELVIGHEGQFQSNRNYGSRVIIPNANLFQSSVLAYIKYGTKKINVEMGASFNMNFINTDSTKNMDYSNGEVTPITRWMPSGNGNIGVSWNPVENMNIKLNFSTGYRAPNLAELSSNGLHEGTYRWEIGDIHMKTEQNFNHELNINYESRYLNLYMAGFVNYFFNYIYLTPTPEQYFGFTIYRFIQKDAYLYGGEISLEVKPVQMFAIQSGFSTVTGQTTDNLYLPFIPANKWTNGIELKGKLSPALHENYVKVGVDYFFAQDHPGQFETATPAYFLLNASIGTTIKIKDQPLTITVSARNLLNETYYDHLSRFKYFNIYNIGRNFSLSVSIPFVIKKNSGNK